MICANRRRRLPQSVDVGQGQRRAGTGPTGPSWGHRHRGRNQCRSGCLYFGLPLFYALLQQVPPHVRGAERAQNVKGNQPDDIQGKVDLLPGQRSDDCSEDVPIGGHANHLQEAGRHDPRDEELAHSRLATQNEEKRKVGDGEKAAGGHGYKHGFSLRGKTALHEDLLTQHGVSCPDCLVEADEGAQGARDDEADQGATPARTHTASVPNRGNLRTLRWRGRSLRRGRLGSMLTR